MMNGMFFFAARSQEAGHEAWKELEKEGHRNVRFMQLDVTSTSSIENVSKTIEREFRNLDILINNAGIMFPPSKVRKILVMK